MTTAKINVRYVNYVQLDRSLTPARKALSILKSSFLEFGPQPKINDLPFGNRPFSSNPEFSNNFITVSLVIGRLPHVMIRTACYWFALWTLWRWWRVTKAMTSWWRRGQCEENWYSSSECSTHTQVRVNVQSHINMHEIHLTNIDRQKRWRDRPIL